MRSSRRSRPTVVLVGVSAVLSAAIGMLGGVIAAWRRSSFSDYSITSSTMVFYSMPDFWLGMLLLYAFAVVLPWFPVGGMADVGANATGIEALLDHLHHLFLPSPHADVGVPRRVRDHRPFVVAGSDGGGLSPPWPVPKACVTSRSATATPSPTLCCRSSRSLRSISGSCCRVRSRSRRCTPGLAWVRPTADAIRGPDLPMLQGLFLVFSAAVIVFNPLADITYAMLDPRVRT